MTAAGELLADEIRRGGPISLRRFMDVALYHPAHGYYRQPRDPFGKAGDFYTAEQIQPVFGILIAARIAQLRRQMGNPADFTVVELGAGRKEMSKAFAGWNYVPIDLDRGQLPEKFRGVVFSNEFFDAVPVEAAVYLGGEFRQQLVSVEDNRFVWVLGAPAGPELKDYFRRYAPPPEEGRRYEANLDALAWIDRIGRSLEAGYALSVDYGYRREEAGRFPSGTLMGYHRHMALEDVLEAPGERDITSHVNFTALQERGAARGLATERFETLAQMLLAAGEEDQFAAALAAGSPAGALRRRMQLKTLLFGMGDTFRALLQRRESPAG